MPKVYFAVLDDALAMILEVIERDSSRPQGITHCTRPYYLPEGGKVGNRVQLLTDADGVQYAKVI